MVERLAFGAILFEAEALRDGLSMRGPRFSGLHGVEVTLRLSRRAVRSKHSSISIAE